jgi:hypothetical protein
MSSYNDSDKANINVLNAEDNLLNFRKSLNVLRFVCKNVNLYGNFLK